MPAWDVALRRGLGRCHHGPPAAHPAPGCPSSSPTRGPRCPQRRGAQPGTAEQDPSPGLGEEDGSQDEVRPGDRRAVSAGIQGDPGVQTWLQAPHSQEASGQAPRSLAVEGLVTHLCLSPKTQLSHDTFTAFGPSSQTSDGPREAVDPSAGKCTRTTCTPTHTYTPPHPCTPTHTHAYEHTHSAHPHVHTHLHTHTHMHTHTQAHTQRTPIHPHTPIHTCTLTHKYTQCTPTCTPTPIHTCTHTQVHT